jgi:hypothetical protein
MATRRRPPIDWDAALRLHEREGWTFAAIARKHGYAYKTVREALRKRGARGRRPIARGEKARTLRSLWRFLHEKCENPRNHSYALYGARGARVAEEWRSFEPFYRWALASGYRRGLRLARWDGNRPYGSKNCVWVTAKERLQLRQPPRRRKRERKKPEPIDWKEATRLFVDEGLSRREVAQRVGASYVGIVGGLKRLGIATAKKARTPEERRLIKTWSSLHARCENTTDPLYPYNGALGVRVCLEWAQVGPFLEWATRAGARPGLWLTRIDRKKGYSPGNCEWVTPQEASKRKPPAKEPSPRRPIKAFGETKGILKWSRDPRCSVSATSITTRIADGWDAERAISEPPQNRGGSDSYFTELEAFGEKKGITDWSRDRRCKVSLSGLDERLRRGWSAEDAVTTPPYRQPRRGSARSRRT